MTYEHPTTIYYLHSVGTMISSDGVTYPALLDAEGFGQGTYDSSNGIHLSDIELGGDWWNGLDDYDRRIVFCIGAELYPCGIV